MTITPSSIRDIRRLAFTAAVALIFIFLLASAVRAERATGEGAIDFVRALGDQAIAVITEPGLSSEERQARLRELLTSGFDLEEIGRFVLGKYWRQASTRDRARFLKAYEDFLMAYYVKRLEAYSGEQIEIEGTRAKGPQSVVVRSRVARPDGPRFKVDWHLLHKDGRWTVVDVVVEGVSLAITHRSEFLSVIRRQGGIGGLVHALTRMAASPRSGNAITTSR